MIFGTFVSVILIILKKKGQLLHYCFRVSLGKNFNTTTQRFALQLSGAWTNLNNLIRKRKTLLDWALKEEQYMFDAAEVEILLLEDISLVIPSFTLFLK